MGLSWTITKYEFTAFINSYLKKGWGKAKAIFAGIITFIVVYISFSASLALFNSIRDTSPPLDVIPTFLGFFFLILLAVVLFSSFSAALYTMFLRSSMELLMSAPLPIKTVLKVKYLHIMLISSILPVAVGIPAVTGFFIAYDFSAISYVLILPVVVAVASLPVGMVMIATVLLMKFISAKRAKEAVGVVVAFFAALVYFFVNVQRGYGQASQIDFSRLAPSSEFLPTSWAAKAFIALYQGSPDFIFYLSMLLGAASLTAWVTLIISERLFFEGWAGTKVSKPGKRKGKGASVFWRLLKPLPQGARAIALKDIKSTPRDLQFWARMFFPLALVGVIVFNLLLGGDPMGEEYRFLVSLVVLGFVCQIFGANLLLPAVGNEGKAYWIIGGSALKSSEMLSGKLAAGYSLLAVILMLLSAGVGVLTGMAYDLVLLLVLLLLIVGLGTSSLALAVGGIFAEFESENPHRKVSLAGSIASLLLQGGYLIIAMLLISLPYVAEYLGKGTLLLYPASWLVVLVFTLLVSYFSIKSSGAILDKREIQF